MSIAIYNSAAEVPSVPPALIRVYIWNMIPGKRYLIRTRDQNTQIYNEDVYATFKGEFYSWRQFGLKKYIEEYIPPTLLRRLKTEYIAFVEEDEEDNSFEDFVFSTEKGIGFVFQEIMWGSIMLKNVDSFQIFAENYTKNILIDILNISFLAKKIIDFMKFQKILMYNFLL